MNTIHYTSSCQRVGSLGFVYQSQQFPEVCTAQVSDNGNTVKTSVKNSDVSCRINSSKVGEFGLMEQRIRCFNDCEFNLYRESVPTLLITLAQNCQMYTNTYHEDRYWQTGDAYLSMFPTEDLVVDRCKKGSAFDVFAITVPEKVIRKLAVRHSESMQRFCDDFRVEHTIFYSKPNSQANRKLSNTFRAIEHCHEMGNYAGKYLETKVFDCLSMMINSANGSDEPLTPVNLVLSDKIYDARDIIRANFQNPPSLHELATMVGTNECTLKSAFKQHFGTTVFQYLFDYRMDLAVKYLRETSMNIADIGMMLGYDSHSHFCTAFHRKFGVSPSEIREEN